MTSPTREPSREELQAWLDKDTGLTLNAAVYRLALEALDQRARGYLMPDEAWNWTIDSAHENGNYMRTCMFCHRSFMGHKRRVVCRVCADPVVADKRAQTCGTCRFAVAFPSGDIVVCREPKIRYLNDPEGLGRETEVPSPFGCSAHQPKEAK